MAEAKIEIKVGGVSFVGEGNENWVGAQLDKMFKHLPDLVKVAPASVDIGGQNKGGGGGAKATGTLASFLSSKKGTASQVRKFLATSLWLQDGGNEHLTTNSVTKALDDNKQGKLANASACLADNVKRGFCEKRGKREFYVTDDGRTEIG